MSNGFVQGLETVGKDVLHVIEAPVVFLEKAEKVIATAIKDQPELKAVLTTLIQKMAATESSVVSAAQGSGLAFAADAAALQEVEDTFAYFKATVIPVIESVYTDVKADL